MEFHINKNSTLPVLKLELIKDGRNDFSKFYEKVENSTVTFTMIDIVTGVIKIGKASATFEQVLPENCVGEEFYITYKFPAKHTAVAGRYLGKFELTFFDGSGNLIVPIRENLYINILDGGIKK
tara:strand:- start:11930 stop:12301 length:372 start_codon:yes stop_codon:yes gene_type:complete